MTHAEALHENRIGLPPSACPGELVPVGRYDDVHLVPGSNPPELTTRTVEVLRCANCRTTIPVSGGVALNAWLDPGEMAASLATAMGGGS